MAEDLSIDAAKPTTLTGYATKVDEDASPEGYLDFDGYLKLMVAQMSNQDFNDPMSDSEFLNQMATYSMMDTISKMNEQSHISYAASLVGKAVTVSGENGMDTGVVESVVISDGKYELLVNGTKYDSDKVTDIVDTNTYNTLTKLVGITATATTESGEKVTGKIQNIIIKDGSGFVIIEGKPYAFESLDFDSTNSGSADGTDNSGSTDGTDNSGSTGGTDNSGSTGGADNSGSAGGTSTASVSASGASMFLADDGYEVIDRTAINEYANRKLAEYYDSIAGGEGAFETEYADDNSAIINAVKKSMTPAEAANAARQNAVMNSDGYYSTSVENVASMFSSKNAPGEEEGVTVRRSAAMSNNTDETSEDYDYLTDIAEKGDVIAVDDEDEEFLDYEDVPLDAGVEIDIDFGNAGSVSAASSGQAQQGAKVTSYMTSSYTPKVLGSYTEDPGVTITGYTDGRNSSYSQWPPSNRAYQNLYPNEAALANQYGTKMFDIRFIHNTDINSVINTDLILGSTVSGKYFTDVGYSGKGKLGEVVTWADGSQRVEIIGRTGSTWFTTTGNYTLDEICDFSDNYKLNGKLSPFEQVIRAAAKEYTPAEQAILDNQKRAYAQHAYYNSAELLG